MTKSWIVVDDAIKKYFSRQGVAEQGSILPYPNYSLHQRMPDSIHLSAQFTKFIITRSSALAL